MARVKRGVTTRAKHKNILEQAKGYRGRRKNTIRVARQAVEINAGVRAEGLSYSQFMHGLKLAGIELDRKVLADIAMHEGDAFTAIIAQAKAALPEQQQAA
jgi:large subunit ribosomal protein L20